MATVGTEGTDAAWAAVVLTGGTASRLGGADKAALEVSGRTLLQRALEAVSGAAEIVVVGPRVPTDPPVRFVREDPPGGGPLAAVAAGVAALVARPARVLVLAVDMPFVTRETVGRLLAAAEGVDAAWLVDATGRRQLAGAVSPALVPDPAAARGAPARVLMSSGRSRDVAATPREADDVDTWDDLAHAATAGASAEMQGAAPPHGQKPGRGRGLEGRARFREIGSVNLHDWIDELCDALDIETEVDEALILDLAKVAADNVVRMAAPVTTYLLGYAAGAAGADEDEVERLAAKAQALAEGWDRPSHAADADTVDDAVPDDHEVDHSGDEYDE